MQFRWNKLNIGGKLISIATLLALISMFMPWVDTGLRTSSGFQQLAFLLLVFYAYPVFIIATGRSISRVMGIGSSLLAAAASVAFMEWKTILFEGDDICFAGYGTFLFFVASLLLFIGILKYQPTTTLTDTPAENSDSPVQ